MNVLPLALAAALFAVAPAFAQTTAAPVVPAVPAAPAVAAPAVAAPATPAAPSLTKDGKPRMKDVRAQCKAEAEAGALKGAARKAAVGDCMIKARPDKAASIQCRMDPALKGLDKEARKTAVKACIAKTKG